MLQKYAFTTSIFTRARGRYSQVLLYREDVSVRHANCGLEVPYQVCLEETLSHDVGMRG